MLVTVLQAKIRYAKVTASNPEYKGSITIDADLLDEMGVVPWQVCDVNSMDGFRGQTYILQGERGTGCVEANGALSAHILQGDIIHINVYCMKSDESVHDHKPIIIETNEVSGS
jgi:aspartate 1-decarboxylase